MGRGGKSLCVYSTLYSYTHGTLSIHPSLPKNSFLCTKPPPKSKLLFYFVKKRERERFFAF